MNRILSLFLSLLLIPLACWSQPFLTFQSGTLDGWTVTKGEPEVWRLNTSPGRMAAGTMQEGNVLTSLGMGEAGTGVIRSEVFTIESPLQGFFLAGADGTATGTNNGDNNFLRLRSHPDGEILRLARPPGYHSFEKKEWFTDDLLGRKVYLEMVDGNPQIRGDGFAWIALGGYKQVDDSALDNPVVTNDIYALPIDQNAELTLCRSLPFLAALPERRGETSRVLEGDIETIPVGCRADTLYLLGMINEGWDYGVAHWGEHPELRQNREDQVFIGRNIGDIEIHYSDGSIDRVPVEMGATAWFINNWTFGPTHGVEVGIREPFASRPEYMKVFRKALRLKEAPEGSSPGSRHTHYYLALEPRDELIEKIVIRDNPEVRGRPLVSGITMASQHPAPDMQHFPGWRAEKDDLEASFESNDIPDWSADLDAVADILYTRDSDLPEKVDRVEFPPGLDVAKIRFTGGVEADMLTNIWTANMTLIDEKFNPETGVFHESVKNIGPFYGGYNGIGTWAPVGVYYGDQTAFGRCTDHYATLALRLMENEDRCNNFMDYVDRWLYFYRSNHDPEKGPPNAALDISRYPEEAPPHWSFVLNSPISIEVNELPGTEEMDGHGATVVGRWLTWRRMGAPTGDWLTAPRENVYGKSRWDATRDAAEFVCWFMDYTGMDVIFCEGETTGWGAFGLGERALIPPGMKEERDPEKILWNYANSDMYEPYPTWVCCVGLKCSAQMADFLGKKDLAERWRSYAHRIENAMFRLLREGDHNDPKWRVSPYSVYPSLQDSLVHAWFALYLDGYDPNQWDPGFTERTRNTLRRQLNQLYGYAPVLAMGYGQGWITQAALMLDEMDESGPLLWNIAKYTYDKNMDYADPERGIDWKRWTWIIPEGTNILPDGSWHRIGDLSNGANQGPPLHAIEICAGVDDTDPNDLKIMPRVPKPLEGIEVENFFTLVPEKKGLGIARLAYSYQRGGRFELTSNRPLPTLSVRLGPFSGKEEANAALAEGSFPKASSQRLDQTGHFEGREAWWIWVEDLRNVISMKAGTKME
jgi:hypothetical protein